MARAFSPQARDLARRLREAGIERTPSMAERMLASARAIMTSTCALRQVSIEVDDEWGLDLTMEEDGETLLVDIFRLEPEEDDVDA